MPAILVAVIVVLPILLVGTIVGAIYFGTKGPSDRAHAFARAVDERRFEKARAMIVDDVQAELSPAEFREEMERSPFIRGGDLSLHKIYVADDRACLDGKANGAAINLRLEKARGEWRIRSTARGNFCR